VCELFERCSLRILTGTGGIEPAVAADCLAEIHFSEFAGSCCNVIKDMDRLADIVFGR
jgi:hypothetical protein